MSVGKTMILQLRTDRNLHFVHSAEQPIWNLVTRLKIPREVRKMIETKNGPIYEPMSPEARPLYEWLKKYQPTLDGSRAYIDVAEIYLSLEFDLAKQNKRHVG